MSDPSFDVFISYRQRSPDREWVRGSLLSGLRAGGVRVFIDFEQFKLGEPLVGAMQRGVEQSAYALAVATPAYFASTYTEFENIMSQHLGLERATNHLLVIVREPCELPLRMRNRLWLPMTTEEEFALNLPRVVAALKER
jgi:hypothetical protein